MNWYLEKIPKILHLYWGNDSLSFLRYLTVYSFRKFNPGWQIRYYYPKIKYRGEKTWHTPEHSTGFKGDSYLERLLAMEIEKIEVDLNELGVENRMPESFKADFLRWHLLATAGGLWSDFDIIYFKPMESLYLNSEANKQIDTLVCLDDNRLDYYKHSIGFLMASADNNFYQFISNQAKQNLDLKNYQSSGSNVLNTYFPNMLTLKNSFPKLKIANLKMETVYPINDRLIPRLYRTEDLTSITGDTIGIHWYAGHPEAGHCENLMTENNYQDHPNVISGIINMII